MFVSVSSDWPSFAICLDVALGNITRGRYSSTEGSINVYYLTKTRLFPTAHNSALY